MATDGSPFVLPPLSRDFRGHRVRLRRCGLRVITISSNRFALPYGGCLGRLVPGYPETTRRQAPT